MHWMVALVLLALGGQQPLLAARHGLDFYFIDVEGGAATLIVTPRGESVLIDCGSPGPRDAGRISQVARQAGLKTIDHLVATHWHSDHFGGTPDLARRIPIGHFYNRGIPAVLNDEPQLYPQMMKAYMAVTHGKFTVLKPGDILPLKQQPGGPALRILTLCGASKFIPDRLGAPKNPIADENLPMDPDPSDNAKSLGFLLTYGAFRFVDLGDLTWNMEYRLVAPTDKIGPVDVFQTSHHGLDISNNPVLIKTVNPRVAVFNNGARKGGAQAVTATLRDLPEIQGIFQVHRNLTVGPEDNTEPACIANDSENCKGEYIKLSVAPDGKSYTVTVHGKGTTRHYKTRFATK